MPSESSDSVFGEGPLQHLFEAVRGGALTEGAALAKASQPTIAARIAPESLRKLSAACRAQAPHAYDAALVMHRLVWACFTHARELFPDLGPLLADNHLRICINVLWNAPEVAVYREALALGEAERARVTEPADRALLANALGFLHLDPYAASRRGAVDLDLWWRSAREPGSAHPDNERGMPDVAHALQIAERWLRSALPDTARLARLRTLKALLQCLYARQVFELPFDEEEARPWVEEAVQLLPLGAGEPQTVAFVSQVAERLGVVEQTDILSPLGDLDWDEEVLRRGPVVISQKLIPALRVARHRDPLLGLRLAQKAEPAVDRHLTEAQRVEFYDAVVPLLDGGADVVVPDLMALLASIEQNDGGGDRAAYAGNVRKVFAIFFQLEARSRETACRQILARLSKAAPTFWQWHPSTLRFLEAGLNASVASTALRPGLEVPDTRTALFADYVAWTLYEALDLPKRAQAFLERLRRVAGLSQSSEDVTWLAMNVRNHPACGLTGRDWRWYKTIDEITVRGLELAREKQDGECAFAALRLSKATAFGNAVLAGRRSHWQADPQLAQSFSRWKRLESETGEAEVGNLFETLLTTYDSRRPENSGLTPPEKRDNLAWTFDRDVRTRTFSPLELGPISLETLRTLIPADAVLLDFYRSKSPGAPLEFLGITREGASLERSPASSTNPEAGFSGDPDATMVIALREELLRAHAGAEPASAGCRQALRRAHEHLGLSSGLLDTLHGRGKRRLLIAPHGPWHFAPVHLLDDGRGPLSDRWTVTSLPAVELLRRPPLADSDRPGAAVFGVSYRDAWARQLGHAVLEEVQVEIDSIAASLGVTPIADAAATRDALLRALENSRYVHVACHGRHNVHAPALQYLQLTPTEGNDGRIYAADLLGLDLSALALLTLSACETALGRIDSGGNPRGLAAAALSSGARCVVGTLWKTSDPAASTFFSQLYACLDANEKPSVAFRTAQLECRARHPHYADWGAFYFNGMD